MMPLWSIKDVRQWIKDDKCPERPSSSTNYPQVHKINTLVLTNPWQFDEECGIWVAFLSQFWCSWRCITSLWDVMPDEGRPNRQLHPSLSGTASFSKDESFLSSIIPGDNGNGTKTKVRFLIDWTDRFENARSLPISGFSLMGRMFFHIKYLIIFCQTLNHCSYPHPTWCL